MANRPLSRAREGGLHVRGQALPPRGGGLGGRTRISLLDAFLVNALTAVPGKAQLRRSQAGDQDADQEGHSPPSPPQWWPSLAKLLAMGHGDCSGGGSVSDFSCARDHRRLGIHPLGAISDFRRRRPDHHHLAIRDDVDPTPSINQLGLEHVSLARPKGRHGFAQAIGSQGRLGHDYVVVSAVDLAEVIGRMGLSRCDPTGPRERVSHLHAASHWSRTFVRFLRHRLNP